MRDPVPKMGISSSSKIIMLEVRQQPQRDATRLAGWIARICVLPIIGLITSFLSHLTASLVTTLLIAIGQFSLVT